MSNDDTLRMIVEAENKASETFQQVENDANSAAAGIKSSFDEATVATESNTDSVKENTGSQDENTGAKDDNTTSTDNNTQSKRDNDEITKDNTGNQKDNTSATEEATGATELLAAAMDLVVAVGLAETLKSCADAAGNYEDSVERAGLALEGVGISSSETKQIVSSLSEETGRSGSAIRESLIQMSSYGITSAEVMRNVFLAAHGQSYILGKSVNELANKYASLAMRSTIMERSLRDTGITMQELAVAMGMQGASVDEVKEKWGELTINQRAAALAQAGMMNEGKEGAEAFKTSWAGLNETLNIALGRLQRIAGEIILPVLIPALEAVSWVLGIIGDGISALMDSDLGPIVSIFVSVGSAIVLAVIAFSSLQAIIPVVTGLIATLGATTSVSLLPLIAIAVAIIAIGGTIFEVGKYFGWWEDLPGMFEAIKAGVTRLWSAFSNNEDVKKVINAVSIAFGELKKVLTPVVQWFMKLLGVEQQSSEEFDIVRAIIDIVGLGFHNLVVILTAVYDAFMFVVGCIQNTIDFFKWLYNILTNVGKGVSGLADTISSYVIPVLQFLGNVITNTAGYFSKLWTAFTSSIAYAKKFVTGVINYIKQLPGQVWKYLVSVTTRIVTAGASWFSKALNAGRQILNGVKRGVTGVATAVYNEFLNIGTKIRQAVTGAVNAAVNFGNNVKDAVLNALHIHSPGIIQKKITKEFMDTNKQIRNQAKMAKTVGAEYGKALNEGVDYSSLNLNGPNTVQTMNKGTIELETTLVHDLKNTPSHLNEADVARMINESTSNKEFIKNLTSNLDFQRADLNAKTRISNRRNRSLGL